MNAPNEVPNAVPDDAIDRAIIAWYGFGRFSPERQAQLLETMASETRDAARAVLAPWAERVRLLERRCAGLLELEDRP